VIAPVRQTSGDAAAGRLGALVLWCGGGFDLANDDAILFEAERVAKPYYVQLDAAGELTSIFGPAPAVVGAVGLVGAGDPISDQLLRQRTRAVAALLVAIAAVLLVIAARARLDDRRAAAAGLVAACSFAGVATLGQDLFQATVALPLLVGALACYAWRARYPRANLATPALLLVAAMVRPTIAPLAVALGIGWALDARGVRAWIVASAIAVAAIAPLVVWNAIHLASPLPVGQWRANEQIAASSLGFVVGIAGQLVSPARGLLWFAPIALLGLAAAWRGDRELRVVACAVIAQLVASATFYKWHGGVTFGPRLLAEAVWFATWAGFVRSPRSLRLVASAVTVLVGLLGLWRYDPDRWETRRKADTHAAALWDFVDSPLSALFSDPTVPRTFDSPHTRGFACVSGGAHSLTAYDP
jgi:hypothetical protein